MVEDEDLALQECGLALHQRQCLTRDLLIEVLTLSIVVVEDLALCLGRAGVLGDEELDGLSPVRHTTCGIDARA